MIRWTFGFKEYPIHITTSSEEEDARIALAIQKPDELLTVQGENGVTLLLNLHQVNVIIRQIDAKENPEFIFPSDQDKIPIEPGSLSVEDVEPEPSDLT